MRVIVLVENRRDASGALVQERGLSLYIETNGVSILFDAGRTDAFLRNAEALGLDIERVAIAVLSHGHNDHVGGLFAFFQKNKKAIAYIKQEALEALFYRWMFIRSKISVDDLVFKKYQARIFYAKNCLEIAKNVFLVTSFKIKRADNSFLRRVNGRCVPDTFAHELVMVVRERDGLVVFTGCAHNGVTNIIDAVQACFPGERIQALLGGFHLMRLPRCDFMGCRSAEVSAISELVQKGIVGAVYTGHCTGTSAYRKMQATVGDRASYLQMGTEINL